MFTFDDFKSKALPPNHAAWNDDPNQKADENTTLIPASLMTNLILNGIEVDNTLLFKDHTTRPFALWVKKQ